MYAVETYAKKRQLVKFNEKQIPKELKKIKEVTQEDFLKAQDHSKDVLAFGMFEGYNDFILEIVIWLCFVPSYLW